MVQRDHRLLELKRIQAEWTVAHGKLLRVDPAKATLLAEALKDLQSLINEATGTPR